MKKKHTHSTHGCRLWHNFSVPTVWHREEWALREWMSNSANWTPNFGSYIVFYLLIRQKQYGLVSLADNTHILCSTLLHAIFKTKSLIWSCLIWFLIFFFHLWVFSRFSIDYFFYCCCCCCVSPFSIPILFLYRCCFALSCYMCFAVVFPPFMRI